MGFLWLQRAAASQSAGSRPGGFRRGGMQAQQLVPRLSCSVARNASRSRDGTRGSSLAGGFLRTDHQQSPKYMHFERSILYHIKNLKFQLCHENFPMSYECSVLLVMSSNK